MLEAQWLLLKLHIKPIMHIWFIMTVVNTYGCHLDEQASLFYEDVFSEIYASPNDTKIIAGDFNLILDPDKDKLGAVLSYIRLPDKYS